MLIKQNGFNPRLNKNLSAVLILVGQEPLLLNNLAVLIKQTWSQQVGDDVDQRVLHINNPNDWRALQEEANSYSLFCNSVLLDVRFDKKTLDASGKAVLQHYLTEPNPRCLVLIRAPDLAVKQLNTLVNLDNLQIMSIGSPSSSEVKQWIQSRLKDLGTPSEPGIAELIQQYNEGNLLACSQVLDKLAILTEPGASLTLSMVKEQLINQCDFSLYELADACLIGDGMKALLLLRQAAANKGEATLVLWLLTQEIRLLMQLQPFAGQSAALRDKAMQLKIWSSRQGLYLKAIARYQPTVLPYLLSLCTQLDSDIKTGQSSQVWNLFEMIALSLCTGKQVGYHA